MSPRGRPPPSRLIHAECTVKWSVAAPRHEHFQYSPLPRLPPSLLLRTIYIHVAFPSLRPAASAAASPRSTCTPLATGYAAAVAAAAIIIIERAGELTKWNPRQPPTPPPPVISPSLSPPFPPPSVMLLAASQHSLPLRFLLRGGISRNLCLVPRVIPAPPVEKAARGCGHAGLKAAAGRARDGTMHVGPH